MIMTMMNIFTINTTIMIRMSEVSMMSSKRVSKKNDKMTKMEMTKIILEVVTVNNNLTIMKIVKLIANLTLMKAVTKKFSVKQTKN